MITPQTRLDHTHRLLRTVPPERLRVLWQMARREGRWPHVAWSRLDAPTPAPECKCAACDSADVPMPGDVCLDCRRAQGEDRERQVAQARERVEAQQASGELPVEPEPKRKRCPDCNRRYREPGRRYCDRCRDARRRTHNREKKRRQRRQVPIELLSPS